MQLAVGDYLILMNKRKEDDGESTRLEERERRRVNMVLSGKSCGLEEAFEQDLTEKSEYYVQRRPKLREKAKTVDEVVKERIQKAALALKRNPGEEDLEGASNKRSKREELSREQLLDQRVKKKNDKFCWF